jgi:hypothetical protein
MNFSPMMNKSIMIRKHNILIILISIAVSVAICANAYHKKQKKHNSFKALIFDGVNGWGYDILVNDNLFIHQESIPASDGKKGFPRKELAIKTAALIINKMENGQLPVITTFELEEIFSLNDQRHE